MRAWVRRHRWVCLWLAALMFGGQVAASAYACPTMGTEQVAAAMADCAMTGNAGTTDPAQPLLCKAHCEAGQQSVNSGAGAASVPAPALIAALWVRALDVAEAAQIASALPEPQSVGPPAGSPPLYLSLLVLRN
jgi:hypothetical protein